MSLDQDIAVRKHRLDALRPLSPAGVRALDAWFDVEITYSSNALEGNLLTRSETAVLLEKGLTVGGKPLKDHVEAIDHRDALDFVRALGAAAEPIREGDIREIHKLVLGRGDPAEAGRYSRHRRAILGSQLVLPSPAEVVPLMADLAAWLKDAPVDYATAFEAHYRLVTIHPFSDGNGRTGRLLMNLVLMRAGYPPVAIGPEARVAYNDVLAMRQSGGAGTAYDLFMRRALLAVLDHYVAHLDDGRP